MINTSFYNKKNILSRTCIAVGVTQIGPRHAARKVESQDSIGYFENQDIICIAVADGVGSSINSGEGSSYAIEILNELISQNDVDKMELDNIKRYIIEKWDKKFAFNIGSYATTLRYSIITEEYVIVGSIGDGKTFLCIDDDYFQFETEDAFLNCTDALSMDYASGKMIIERYAIKNSMSIALMTDGISNEIELGKEQSFLKYLFDVSVTDELLNELQQWIEGLNKVNSDDKSICFIRQNR